jgi:hypothetical protein
MIVQGGRPVATLANHALAGAVGAWGYGRCWDSLESGLKYGSCQTG